MKHIHSKRSWFVIFRSELILLYTALLFGTTTVFAANATGDLPYQSAFEDYHASSKDTLTDWKTVNQSSEGGGHSGHQMQGMQHDMPTSESKSAESSIDHSAIDHSKMATLAQPSTASDVDDHGATPHAHDADSGMQGQDMTKPMPSVDKPVETSVTSVKTASTGFSIIPNMHPTIVHFPIALTLISLLFGLSALILRKHSVVPLLATAGHFTLWLSTISAVVAAIFGWLAFNSGRNHDDAGHAAMLLHRKWAIPTALGLVALACWDAWKTRINQVMALPVLAPLFVLSAAIATTAWLGGEIVYRHGIGVLSLPASEGAGHGHPHNGSNATEHSHEATNPDGHSAHQHDTTQGGAHEH